MPWWREFFDEEYPVLYAPTLTPERTEREVAAAVGVLKVRDGARRVDLCCGEGRQAGAGGGGQGGPGRHGGGGGGGGRPRAGGAGDRGGPGRVARHFSLTGRGEAGRGGGLRAPPLQRDGAGRDAAQGRLRSHR